jgi:hypothetical protein
MNLTQVLAEMRRAFHKTRLQSNICVDPQVFYAAMRFLEEGAGSAQAPTPKPDLSAMPDWPWAEWVQEQGIGD